MDQSNFLKLQMQMQNNNSEYNDFLNDISSWKNNLAKHEPSKEIKTDKSQLPIRNKTTVTKTIEQRKKNKKIKAYDYREWDKFDVDKALEEADKESNKVEVEETEDVVTSRLLNEYRDVGNLRFKEKKYREAIDEYTKGVTIDQNNAILYCNRAMAYIKIEDYANGMKDCTKAIQIDSGNVKAFFRRALCKKSLKMYDEAVEDVKNVLILEPTNKPAKSLLEELNPRGIVKPIFNKPLLNREYDGPMYSVNITEVNPDSIDKAELKETKSDASTAPSISANSSMNNIQLPEQPRNSVQLNKHLRLLNYPNNRHLLSQYIIQIPSSQYRNLIGHSLDSQTLLNFLVGLSNAFKVDLLPSSQFVHSLNDLALVERFSSSFMMLSKEELQGFNESLNLLEPSIKEKIRFIQ